LAGTSPSATRYNGPDGLVQDMTDVHGIPEDPTPPRPRRRWGWPQVLLGLAAAAALVWPLGRLPWDALRPPARWDERPLVVADAPPRGGLDVTFLVAADVHCAADPAPAGKTSDEEQVLTRQVEAMEFVSQQPWPAEIGDRVGPIAGLIVAGDLTEEGKPAQWKQFERWFGLTGREGALAFPVYECTGNHDRVDGPLVAKKVAERHGADYYGWDWSDLRVVSLGEYPTVEAVNWLRRDLSRVGRRRPVVLFMHYPPPGEFAKRYWIDKPENYRRLAETMAAFNVVGIFHGHHHGTGQYTWAGVDVYNVGETKRGTNSFAVVHVTDESMTVGYWNWAEGKWDWSHRKAIGRGRENAATTRRQQRETEEEEKMK